MNVGKVAAVLCNIGGILGGGAAVAARSELAIHRGAAGHVQSVHDHAVVGAAGVARAVLVVFPSEVLAHAHPLVELVLAVVVQGQVLVVGVAQHAIVFVVVERDAVGKVGGAHVEGHVVALVHGCAEYFVHPVGACGGHPGVLGRVPAVGQGEAGVGIGGGAHLDFFFGSEPVGQVVGLAHPEGAAVAECGVAFLGLLGGDQDHAAGSRLGAVDGCRGGILEHDDALDVVERGNGCPRHAVDYPKHVVAVARALAAYHDAGRSGGVAAVRLNGHARYLALHHALGAGHRAHGKLGGVAYHAHRCRQVFLLGLCTIANGYNLVEHLAVVGHGDVEVAASCCCHGFVANGCDHQLAPCRSVEGELAVDVGGYSQGRSCDFDRGSNDRFSFRVLYYTSHLLLTRCCRCGSGTEHRPCQCDRW